MHISEQEATNNHAEPLIRNLFLREENIEKHPSKDDFLTKRRNKDHHNFKQALTMQLNLIQCLLIIRNASANQA